MSTNPKQYEISENSRQTRFSDDRYFKVLPYMFELQVPAAAFQNTAASTSTSFFYTLPRNPQNLILDEPFTVATVPGINGGLVVEENGIVERTLRLSGVTGFAPSQMHQHTPDLQNSIVRSFTSRGDYFENNNGRLSGQRHLEFLQDRVFRAYADLKRDPRFSRGVHLYFHNRKDKQSWEVVPTAFTVNRRAPKSTLYYYEISLIVVGPSDAVPFGGTADPEKATVEQFKLTTTTAKKPFKFSVVNKLSWTDLVRQALARARKELEKISAAINDVIKYVDEIQNFVRDVRQGIRQLVDEVLGWVGAVVRALDQLVAIPGDLLKTATRIVDAVRNTAIAIAKTIGTIAALPDSLVAMWHRLGDSIERFAGIAVFYNQEREGARRDLANVRGQDRPLSSFGVSTNAIESRTIGDLSRAGTAPTLNEVVTALQGVGDSRVPQINSLTYHAVRGSDNITTLAARYLGDAEFWWVIAELNGLQPPYISNIPFPGTVRPGQTLLIPSTAPVTPEGTRGGVITDADASAEVRTLYRDMRLETSSRNRGRYDLKLDPAKGYRDVRYVEGVSNLQQALRTRLETTLGENPIFPTLGIPRSVGVGNTDVDTEIVRIMVGRAITADGRVNGVNSIRVSTESAGDAYVIDADVAIRGVGAVVPIPSVRAMVR